MWTGCWVDMDASKYDFPSGGHGWCYEWTAAVEKSGVAQGCLTLSLLDGSVRSLRRGRGHQLRVRVCLVFAGVGLDCLRTTVHILQQDFLGDGFLDAFTYRWEETRGMGGISVKERLQEILVQAAWEVLLTHSWQFRFVNWNLLVYCHRCARSHTRMFFFCTGCLEMGIFHPGCCICKYIIFPSRVKSALRDLRCNRWVDAGGELPTKQVFNSQQRRLTHSCVVGVWEALVYPLPHEHPAVVVEGALDDLVVVQFELFRGLRMRQTTQLPFTFTGQGGQCRNYCCDDCQLYLLAHHCIL